MGGFEFQRSAHQYLQTLPPPGTLNPDLIFRSPTLDTANDAIVNGQDLGEAKEGANMKNRTEKHTTIYHKKERMVFAIEKVMEMRTPTGTTLSFCYVGNPPAQWHARFTFPRGPFCLNGTAAASCQWFYNPDARSKAIFGDALTAAIGDLDIVPLPFVGV
jgi:hypothetical protein